MACSSTRRRAARVEDAMSCMVEAVGTAVMVDHGRRRCVSLTCHVVMLATGNHGTSTLGSVARRKSKSANPNRPWIA